MKALQIIGPNEVALIDTTQPAPGSGEVLVKLKAASLNRRDHWIREGKYPNIQFNKTLGSDGSGEVVEIGAGVAQHWLNQAVVINPNVHWGDDPRVQSPQYQVLGMPIDGTLAEYIVVPEHRIQPKPAHLSFEQAAAIPLAGLTAYRALFYHGEMQKGQQVLITGAGGGVSQMAFLWAHACGAEVYVTSGSDEKLQKMLQYGAVKGWNYRNDWEREVAAAKVSFDLVIDSGGGAQLNALIKLVKPAGRIVFYGATTGLPPKLDLYRMFWNQVRLQGSTMGNDQEFIDMLKLTEERQLEPMIDSVRPFDQVVDALDRMREGQQFGKIVLSIT